MAPMNTQVLTILVALAFVACLAIIKKIKKRNYRNQEPETKNSYNDFYLGEMTHHDLPAGYIKRDNNVKWNSQDNHPEKIRINKKENQNGKESKK